MPKKKSMSKELDRLEHLRLGVQYISQDKSPAYISQYEEDIDAIEAALKRLEEHDKIFEKYGIDDNWLEIALFVIKMHFPMDTETQLMKLKALEIIKEKQVDCDALMFYLRAHKTGNTDYAFDSYNDYAKDSGKRQLTKEEFDSLKEVLK